MPVRYRILVLAVVLSAAGGVYWYMTAEASRPEGQIWTSGNIEVTTTEVSFKLPGRVAERPIDEGQTVERGQVIARLDDSELRQELAARKAELQQAEAALAELEAGSRKEEIEAAAAAVRKAEAALRVLEEGSRRQEVAVAESLLSRAAVEKDRAQADFDRARQLLERKAMSQEDFDRVKAAYEVATEAFREATEQLDLVREGPREQLIEQARAALDEARAQRELVVKGPREEKIAQARAKVEQARAATALAQVRLDDAVLAAPVSGVVLSKAIEPGEYVAPGTPVVTVGNLETVWVRAYIEETDVGRVKLGQAAHVFTDTFPGKVYTGRVSFISPEAEFTPKSVQTQQERVKLVYRIKIDIPNPDRELLPGMPADARVLIDEKQP